MSHISGLYDRSNLLLALLVQDRRVVSCKPLGLKFPEVLVQKEKMLHYCLGIGTVTT